MDECFKNYSDSVRASNISNFIEKKIWDNLLSDSEFKPSDDMKFLCLTLDNKKLPLKEVLFSEYIRMDKG